jgi:hypothetical protein
MENPPLTGFHYRRGSGYVYDVLFFSATGLDPTVQHIVTWVNTPGEADNGSMLFDYAQVTVDLPQSSASGGSTSLSYVPFIAQLLIFFMMLYISEVLGWKTVLLHLELCL